MKLYISLLLAFIFAGVFNTKAFVNYTDNTFYNSTNFLEDSCKGAVNIINKTENELEITIYIEPPYDNPSAKKAFIIKVAPNLTKKLKIQINQTYYYLATNMTGEPVFGGYQNYSGSFEIESCNDNLQEVIK